MARIAIWLLRYAVRHDDGYAWSWHCSLAMAAADVGVDPALANKAASLFMMRLFKVATVVPETHTTG